MTNDQISRTNRRFRLWKVWGVDLKEDHLIENTPRLIFIGFVTMFVATLMSTITLLFSMCSYYAMMIAVVLSFVRQTPKTFAVPKSY
jgi:hypothetical protein